jgi:ribosomal protein S18 acetylase RimI-like enzyme
VHVALATINDATEILALQRLAYQTEAALYNDWSIPPLMQTLDELRAEFAHMMILKTGLKDRIVGSVRAYERGGVCFIGRLIVHPQFQRQGIGSRLMRAVESSFSAAAKFELFTGNKSEGNIRLYKRLGYGICRTQVVSSNLSLVFLEKVVRSAL